MKTKMIAVLSACMFIAVSYANAGQFCPVGVECAPVPTMQYITEQVPVTTTRMIPVDRQVMVPKTRWVYETRQVPCTRTEYVNEAYTVYEPRYERRPETRMRRVTRTVRETEAREVARTIYENSCGPCGQNVRVARKVYETKYVPVKRRVCVDEPYTVNVRHKVSVPVTKTRRVARQVPAMRSVQERRCITEMVPQTVREMRAVTETRMESRQRAVCTTQYVERPVVQPVCGPTCF